MRIGDEVHKNETCILADRRLGSGASSERARVSLWRDVLPPESFDEISVSDEKSASRQVRINDALRR